MEEQSSVFLCTHSSLKLRSNRPGAQTAVTTTLHLNHQHLRYPSLPFPMDNSPTSLFDSYEQDFQQIIDSIKLKLEGDAKDERPGESPSIQ